MIPVQSYPGVDTPYGLRGRFWTWLGYHTGNDYACPDGSRVTATSRGVVDRASYSPADYGYYVRVRNTDGVTMWYAHLSRIGVRVGQAVEAGAFIGLSGNSGNSSGPHTHYEERGADGMPRTPRYDVPGGTRTTTAGDWSRGDVYVVKLRPGQANSASVCRLQHKLGVQTTGFYGPTTEGRVREWQRAHGRNVSGDLGLHGARIIFGDRYRVIG